MPRYSPSKSVGEEVRRKGMEACTQRRRMEEEEKSLQQLCMWKADISRAQASQRTGPLQHAPRRPVFSVSALFLLSLGSFCFAEGAFSKQPGYTATPTNPASFFSHEQSVENTTDARRWGIN